jgi:chaperone BCS1
MGKYLERDVYFINLNGVSSDAIFMELIVELNKDCIIVFEDIDSFNQDRLGEKDKTGVSFTGLLNTLNGALEPNNCIIIMTANNIGVLDPALIRPGRIDKVYLIDNPSWKSIKDFLSAFYGVKIWDSIERDYNIKDETKFTVSMSQIQDWCLQHSSEVGYVDVIEELSKNIKYE